MDSDVSMDGGPRRVETPSSPDPADPTLAWRVAGPAAARRARRFLADRRGGAVIEFALIAPVFTMVILALAQFGITVNNFVQLTNAVSAGARQLSISRPSTTPRSSTVNALNAAAPSLTSASITITTTVAGSVCTTDAARRCRPT